MLGDGRGWVAYIVSVCRIGVLVWLGSPLLGVPGSPLLGVTVVVDCHQLGE